MRISKEIAKQVADVMLSNKKAAVDKLFEDLRKSVTENVVLQTPCAVLDLYAKAPEYFTTQSSIYTHQLGGYVKFLSKDKDVKHYYLPRKDNMYLPSDSEVKLFQEWTRKTDKLRVLKAELEATLHGLRTYKNVSLHFPEAVPFLPKFEKTEIAIGFGRLRQRLSSKTF
ncbi:hypothetical protein [Lacihabitans soyangensis]|uniref:Uncharacterized protein n=1 Tax=Lacihabitans soyangensis TaxID=869394 RepID=A0AAE3H6D2_9BACT|nr:hypothetical protein [Lacihabitans soyangensis]MCP9763830.1 hypothetical protein [Lacihabitans soyangensis]